MKEIIHFSGIFTFQQSYQSDSLTKVAERVIKKGEEHMIGKNAFNVRSFAEESIKTCNKKLSEENHVYSEEFEHIDFVVSEVLRTAEIHGEIDKLSVDTLSLYLESKKSGGGHIEKLDVSVSPALVTFKEVADAERFCRIQIHKCSGVEFRVTPARPKRADPRYLLLCNINPNSTDDSIKNYVEIICDRDVEDIVFQPDHKVARIAVEKPPDWKKVEENLARKPKYRELDRFKVEFKKLPLCTSILITNFSEKTTEDGITIKLEHPSVGEPDCVKNVDFKERNNYAIVYFETPEVVAKILPKKITLDGSTWELYPYYDCFISDEVEKIIKASTKIVRVPVDVDIIAFIQASDQYRIFLASVLPQNEIKSRIDQDGNHFIDVAENSEQSFIEFYTRFEKVAISVEAGHLQSFGEDLEKEVNHLQSSVKGCVSKIHRGKIIVAGGKQSVKAFTDKIQQRVQELEKDFITKQEQKELFPAPPDKFTSGQK